MTETTILDEGAVSEIEARANAASRGLWEQQFITGKGYTVWVVKDRGSMQVAVFGHAETFDKDNAEFTAYARQDIPALCATVKHLRERLDSIKSKTAWHRDGIGPDVPVMQERYDKLIAQRDDLQSQLEQLRAENEALRKEVANSEKYQAQLLSSDLVSRSRVIQLCKDKAAEWRKQTGTVKGQRKILALTGMAVGADEMATELEKL